MKLAFLPADAQGRHDGILHNRLWSHLPHFTHGRNPDATIVPVSHFSDYQFNPALRSLEGKKWILADTSEFYGQWPAKTFLWGRDRLAIGGNEEWCKLSDWIRDNPPALSFVRELWKEDASDIVKPLEWPAYQPAWPIESRESFNTRPFEVFFCWGLSDCSRPRLHGDIWKGGCHHGYETIGNFDHIDTKRHEPIRKWISVHVPHTHRRHYDELALRQAQSKLTVGLKGAGYKCFRNTEFVHTAPAIHDPGLAWSFPWVHKQNCIVLKEGHEYMDLVEAIRLDREGHINLYDIYVAAQANLDNYRPENYISRHILPSIEANL